MNYFKQESNRLKFRELTTSDIPLWTEFFINNDRLDYLGIDVTKPPKTLAENWILKQLERYEKSGLGHLAVELKSTNTFIGVGGIIPRIVDDKPEMEIAYSLIPKFWKNGYGTELAIKMKTFGLEHLDSKRFVSIIHKENTDSIRVAEKNKMEILYETNYLGMAVFVYGIESN